MSAGGPGAPPAPAAATQRTFRIVISYRRVDTGGDARSLAEALERRFGRDNVFLDIEAIEPGEPFDQAIDRAVASSDVLLALIGQHWLTLTDEEGRRRIDDPRDVVRLEVGSALAQGVWVIPVLLEDAKMPSEESLPPELAPFSKRNAVELRATRWKVDVEDFVGELAALKREKFRRLGPEHAWQRILEPLAAAGGAGRRAAVGHPRAAATVALVAALLLAALAAVFVLRDGGGDDTLPHSPLAADETLAFASDARIMLLDGVAERPDVMPVEGLPESPDVTADGRRIVFKRGNDLWIADRDGSNEEQLTGDGANDGAPSVSGQGLVAFDRPKAEDPQRRGIWVVRADGSDSARPLQQRPDQGGVAPDWSPDGRWIVYQRGVGRNSIWFMDANGHNQRELLPGSTTNARSPAWAPRGGRIAFVLPDEPGCHIGIVRVRGQDVTPLAPLAPDVPAACSEPAWSPDGRHLVVVADDGLWAVPLDENEEPRRLLAIARARSPSWTRRPG